MTYTLATICARAASKGLPGKNVAIVGQHPLIAYSLAVGRACDFLDRVIVSTDSAEVATVARMYGGEVPFLRPAHMASDTASKASVLQHAVREIERQTGRRVDIIIDLQVTSPIRRVEDIRACWNGVQEAATDVVFTVCALDPNPYFNMVELEGDYARISKRPPRPIVRRQDAPRVYTLNGSIYAYRRDYLLRDGAPVSPRSRIVIMPQESSIDIDRPIDLEFLRFLVDTERVQLPRVPTPLIPQ